MRVSTRVTQIRQQAFNWSFATAIGNISLQLWLECKQTLLLLLLLLHICNVCADIFSAFVCKSAMEMLCKMCNKFFIVFVVVAIVVVVFLKVNTNYKKIGKYFVGDDRKAEKRDFCWNALDVSGVCVGADKWKRKVCGNVESHLCLLVFSLTMHI